VALISVSGVLQEMQGTDKEGDTKHRHWAWQQAQGEEGIWLKHGSRAYGDCGQKCVQAPDGKLGTTSLKFAIKKCDFWSVQGPSLSIHLYQR
jgi:hypothetical protein